MIWIDGVFSVNRMSDSRVLRRLARRCWPKMQHGSREGAEWQMRDLLEKGLEKDPAMLHVYRCPECGSWHVGHGQGGV